MVLGLDVVDALALGPGPLGSGVGGHDDDVGLATTELFYSRLTIPKSEQLELNLEIIFANYISLILQFYKLISLLTSR